MHAHTEYVEGCFACKAKSLHFGVVPGGSRWSSSKTNYDADTLPDFPSKEEVMDYRADFEHAPVKEMKLDAETGRFK